VSAYDLKGFDSYNGGITEFWILSLAGTRLTRPFFPDYWSPTRIRASTNGPADWFPFWESLWYIAD